MVELQPTLLGPEGFTAVFGNELWLWSWTTEVLVGVPNSDSPRRYIEIDDLNSGPGFLLRIAARTALAESRPPNAPGKEAWKEMMQRKLEGDPNSREMLSNKTSILAYLAFPLLEGLTKMRCSAYVDLNGRVVAPFQANNRPYDPVQRPNRINSLQDLLWLLHSEVADADERAALESIRASILQATGMDAYEQVYRWRNSSLHGAESLRAIGYTVYNLALLVGLHGIQRRYEEIRDDAHAFFAEVAGIIQSGVPYFTPWHYYPPYWEASPPGIHYFSTG